MASTLSQAKPSQARDAMQIDLCISFLLHWALEVLPSMHKHGYRQLAHANMPCLFEHCACILPCPEPCHVSWATTIYAWDLRALGFPIRPALVTNAMPH